MLTFDRDRFALYIPSTARKTASSSFGGRLFFDHAEATFYTNKLLRKGE
jgi:hypothetical protein